MSKKKNQNKSNTPLLPRPPVVTFMGHVDHGKTSLLDAIRNTRVADKEIGSMTQQTRAHQIKYKGQPITFIDTPGHAAFSQMRSRGGQVADIVVLVVAADDGVKPQTKEAIDHARAANAPIIVAVNKIDLPSASADKIYQELTQEGLVVEKLGGEVVSVETSAKEKKGLDDLLEMILLVAEIEGLSLPDNKFFEGVVLESWLDSRQGVSATLIVRSGQLKLGDNLFGLAGLEGKTKALWDSEGNKINQAGPGDPVVVLGLESVPEVGSVIAGEGGQEYIKKLEELLAQQRQTSTLEGVSSDSEGERILNLILKADTRGSLEAIQGNLLELVTEEAKINIIHQATGDISDSDIMLATASNAIIFGFRVQCRPEVSYLAKTNLVEVRVYNLIFELIDDTKKALQGIFEEKRKKIKGRAEVIKLFPLPSGNVILGCRVEGGVLSVGDRVKISRKEEEIHRAKIHTIKVNKEKVKRVSTGEECGILLRPEYPSRKGDIVDRV